MKKIIHPEWPAPDNVHAYSTTRIGGESVAPFESLNLGLHVGDSKSAVLKNRQNISSTLELPDNITWLNQIHSNDVIVTHNNQTIPNADAIISDNPNQVCVIMTADCLPILLTNQKGTEVAAIHAGWKGLEKDIIHNTLSKFKSSNDSILAWLGPCISQEKYQVGYPLLKIFTDKSVDNKLAFIKQGKDYYLCLKSIATNQLKSAGVDMIFKDNHCTHHDKDLFFSYRREQTTGRMATLIYFD
jgi:polyphenol oxidase